MSRYQVEVIGLRGYRMEKPRVSRLALFKVGGEISSKDLGRRVREKALGKGWMIDKVEVQKI